MNNPRGYILLFLFFAMISAYFFMRHERKINRHQNKLLAYQSLLTSKAKRSSFEIIRHSKDAIVYTFFHKTKSFRSSAPAAYYNPSEAYVYFLPESPKINSLQPSKEVLQLNSSPPSAWRFPLAIVLLLSSLAFLVAFISPVFRERLEYWMYKRRASKS